MSIPLATTTVRVWRVPADPDRDPTDTRPAAQTVAEGVRAHISTAAHGREERMSGAERSVVNFRMSCDQFVGGLAHTDTVEDEQTGEVYEVRWSVARNGLNLDHFQAGLDQISGVV